MGEHEDGREGDRIAKFLSRAGVASRRDAEKLLAEGRVVLDPSRVAAQIVSGIGFIGGGVIFMRRDAVRGLTTAASV